jgi:hypothetical protein
MKTLRMFGNARYTLHDAWICAGRHLSPRTAPVRQVRVETLTLGAQEDAPCRTARPQA